MNYTCTRDIPGDHDRSYYTPQTKYGPAIQGVLTNLPSPHCQSRVDVQMTPALSSRTDRHREGDTAEDGFLLASKP